MPQNEKIELPGFEMIEKVGQGGMASVWRARQVSLDRIVAIKVLLSRARDDADTERFVSEAQATAKLKHNGVLQIYDANVHNGIYYFVMEHIAGYSVGEWIRRKGVIPEADALVVAESVATALEYGWESQHVIHCDIKPDNVMVDADGSIKVADLGLARTIGAVSRPKDADEVTGTPNYMSPEQVLGVHDLDFRTDIYSLGAMLYHMVTGKMLFEDLDGEEVMKQQVDGTSDDALDMNPKLSMSICWLIEKMLTKDRAARYSDWKAVITDLHKARRGAMLASQELAEGASTMKRSANRTKPRRSLQVVPEKGGRRIPAAVWVAIAAAAAIVVVGIFVITRAPPPIVDHDVSPIMVDPQGPGRDDQAAAQMYRYALTWTRTHSGEYDKAIEQFRKVMRDTTGTKYSLMARERIKELQVEMEEAVAAVLTGIRNKADALVEQKKFQEARAVYEEYAGEFSANTEAARRAGAVAVQRRADEYEVVVKTEQKRLADEYNGVLDSIAMAVVDGRFAQAIQLAADACTRGSLSAKSDELKNLEYMLRTVATMDSKIGESFAAQEGRTVNVPMVSGEKTFKVVSVTDRVVVGEERVHTGAYTASKRVEIRFEDLSYEETIRRLGTGTSDELLIKKGALAVRAGEYEQAREFFSKVSPLMSTRLMERVSGSAVDHQERIAEYALSNLLKSLGIDAGEFDAARWAAAVKARKLSEATIGEARSKVERYRREYETTTFLKKVEPVLEALSNGSAAQGPAGELDEAAVRKALLSRNRSLNANEIIIDKKTAFPGYRLAVNTDSLTDLGTLRTVSDGIVELDLSNSSVRQLGAMGGMALRALILADSKVSSLPLMVDVPLELLNLRNTEIRNFMSLSRLRLKNLDLGGTKIQTLDVIKNMPLVVLNLERVEIDDRDLSVLSEIGTLAHLNLSGTKITTISPIKKLRLQTLELGGCRSLNDFSSLSDMPLSRLGLSRDGISDLDILRGLPLTRLDISHTKVTSLEPLRGMALVSLNLRGTEVTDLTPLKGMPLRYVDCVGVTPNDWGPLAGMPIQDFYFSPQPQAILPLLRTLSDLRRINGRAWGAPQPAN